MSTKFVQLFSALLLFSSAFCAQFELQRIDLFQRLGFNESTNSTTAAEDNFDAFLAFGSSVYTARLGVGTPAQPIDFLLNFVGDMISPGVGDISFVLTPTAKFNETLAFVSGDSSTFLPRPDITFKTAIQFNPLQMKVRGGLGEDIITFKDSQTNATYLIRENRLGQIDQIQGQLFDQLNIGGIINMGKRSLLHKNISNKASGDMYALYLDDRRGMLFVGNKEKEFCRDPFASVEMVKAAENQTETGIQNTIRIEINGLFMQTPESTHTDREKKIALMNPNSPFIQGPRKTVTQLAFMVDAEKVQIGRHQLYTINCNQSYGPLQFTLNYDYKITLPKASLRIELPGNLLPEGQCLWGIQELPLAIAQFNNAEWVIGQPYFKENCMAIYPYNGNIAFSRKKQ